MSYFQLICPNLKCRSVLRVPQGSRGKVVRCKKCSARIQVPSGASKPRPAPTGEAEADSGS